MSCSGSLETEDGDGEGDIAAAWTDEIGRRVNEVEAGTVKLHDLNTVRARLEAAGRLTKIHHVPTLAHSPPHSPRAALARREASTFMLACPSRHTTAKAASDYSATALGRR
jgi:hypothetical protein